MDHYADFGNTEQDDPGHGFLGMKQFARKLFFGISTLLVFAHAAADSPPAALVDAQTYSQNRRYFAVSELRSSRTRVFGSGHKKTHLWEFPGFYPVLFVANDGKHLVVGHPDGNLLPKNARADEPFLIFYTAKKTDVVIRKLTIGDIFPDLSLVPKTVSHRAWGNYLGFDHANWFGIVLFDGRVLLFDPETGRQVKKPKGDSLPQKPPSE